LKAFGIIFALFRLKMRTMKTAILIWSILFFFATTAFAETYKWLDEKGDAHYTDDFMKIPERYRSSIKKLDGEEAAEPPKKGADTAITKEAPVRDRMGRGEDYWRGRVEELRKKIRTLEEKNGSLRLKYNEVTLKFNDSKSSVERANLRVERDQIRAEIDRTKAEMDEARIELEKKIPEEAELFKAKPDWIK
jgi:hypothetical protein